MPSTLFADVISPQTGGGDVTVNGAIIKAATILTAAQLTDLTDTGDSTAHFHSADRARANHTGTQADSTVVVGAWFSAGNKTGAVTFDRNNGRYQTCTITGNWTSLTINNLADGESIVILINTANFTYSGAGWTTGVRWMGATVPTPTTTAAKIDMYQFTKQGANLLGFVVGQGA